MYRSEVQKTTAKCAVGVTLQRRHIHRYVEEQSYETSVAARIFKPQQMATANFGLMGGRKKLLKQAISRVLFPNPMIWAMAIHLGYLLPGTSSDLPGSFKRAT